MADDLSKYLLSGTGGFALTPEKLELMGKEAASLLIEKNVPLTDGVVKIASQHPDMNAEQVRRVVEFANTAAYLSFHDKNKTAGSEHSYPQFVLADPQAVLKKLSNAQSQEGQVADVTYLASPSRSSISTPERERALEELFLGTGSQAKTAAVDFTPESAAEVIVNAKHDLIDLRDNLASSGERFEILLKTAEADYYDSMKRHLMDGGSFVDVLRGANETGLPSQKIASILGPFIKRLIDEKVASVDEITLQSRGLSKVAHRVVDPTHPFVAGFSALHNLLDETEKVASALEDVDMQLDRVKQAIREEFLAG